MSNELVRSIGIGFGAAVRIWHDLECGYHVELAYDIIDVSIEIRSLAELDAVRHALDRAAVLIRRKLAAAERLKVKPQARPARTVVGRRSRSLRRKGPTR